jgi:Uma2 family endonuclease
VESLERSARQDPRLSAELGRFAPLDSAPEPDLVWVVQRDYSQSRPVSEEVLLVVEVSESSLAYDTGEKAFLYAEAGIADYWVVNLVDHAVEVRRDPASGRYRGLQTFSGNQEIRPLALPELVLRPQSLWD